MKIELKKSELHGNGVFAAVDISKDEIIEVCPIIILDEKDTVKIDETFLYNYYFGWDENKSAICLGYGSIYNHSYQPNAKYEKDFSKGSIVFKSIREIKRGEEILVNYNGEPTNQEKVWFDK